MTSLLPCLLESSRITGTYIQIMLQYFFNAFVYTPDINVSSMRSVSLRTPYWFHAFLNTVGLAGHLLPSTSHLLVFHPNMIKVQVYRHCRLSGYCTILFWYLNLHATLNATHIFRVGYALFAFVFCKQIIDLIVFGYRKHFQSLNTSVW